VLGAFTLTGYAGRLRGKVKNKPTKKKDKDEGVKVDSARRVISLAAILATPLISHIIIAYYYTSIMCDAIFACIGL